MSEQNCRYCDWLILFEKEPPAECPHCECYKPIAEPLSPQTTNEEEAAE